MAGPCPGPPAAAAGEGAGAPSGRSIPGRRRSRWAVRSRVPAQPVGGPSQGAGAVNAPRRLYCEGCPPTQTGLDQAIASFNWRTRTK